MDNKKDNKILPLPNEARNLITLSLFEHDNYLIFSYKKAERIISAVYLITNLFPDQEPIKWQFRELGLDILNQILSFKTLPLSKNQVSVSLISNIVRTLSILDISKVAGLLSEMNYAILKSELENLLQSMNFKSSDLHEKNVLLNKEFFGVPEGQLTLNEDTIKVKSSSFGDRTDEPPEDKNAVIYNWSEIGHFQRGISKGHNKGHINVKDNNMSDSKSDRSRGSTTLALQEDNRQTIIVDLLKKKSHLSIKDFSLIIKDCSAKTIQRELLYLVGCGVLKKEGERRWSRYSLA